MLFTIFQTLKTIVFCHLHEVQTLKVHGFLLLHEVQTTKDVVFCYST